MTNSNLTKTVTFTIFQVINMGNKEEHVLEELAMHCSLRSEELACLVVIVVDRSSCSNGEV